MPTEDEIRNLLPVQQVTLARAALAGITYEKVDASRRIHAGMRADGNWSRGQSVMQTKICARWPDGTYVSTPTARLREFDDEHEAAVYCLAVLDAPRLKHEEEHWPSELFKVKE